MAELPLPEKGQQISEHSDPPKASPGLPEPPPPAAPENAAPLTWAEIVEHCSRLHTTRTRRQPYWPDVEREDSHMLDVWVTHGIRLPAVVVPTRMHEPGFYVRCPNGYEPNWTWRSEDDLARFQTYVENGRVTRRA